MTGEGTPEAEVPGAPAQGRPGCRGSCQPLHFQLTISVYADQVPGSELFARQAHNENTRFSDSSISLVFKRFHNNYCNLQLIFPRQHAVIRLICLHVNTVKGQTIMVPTFNQFHISFTNTQKCSYGLSSENPILTF